MWESPAQGGWGHPWAGGARFYKETDRASHEEPASEQHPTPMMSASAPASRSPPSFLQWWTMMWKCKPINPFLPSCFWPLSFITGVTLNHFPVPPMCSSALSTRCFFCSPQASLCQNWHSSLVLSASLSLGFSLFGFNVYSRLDKGFFFFLVYFLLLWPEQFKGWKTSWAYTSRSPVTMEGRQSRNRRRNHGGVPLLWPPSSWVMLG